ncbi:hypothetical protein OIU78_002002, partial [Salix suchowensis]
MWNTGLFPVTRATALKRLTRKKRSLFLRMFTGKNLDFLFLSGSHSSCYRLQRFGTSTCSTAYWVLNLLQIPVSVGVSMY